MKTLIQARNEFKEKGIKISDWAMQRGINPSVVTDVLRGRTKGTRGACKKAMHLLGLDKAA